MISRMRTLTVAWRKALQKPRFTFDLIVTAVLFLASLYLCGEVIHYAHTRPGVQLNDPLLHRVGPVSLRVPIFLALWSSLLLGVYALAKTPPRFVLWLQASAVLACLRAIALFLVPLEPLPSIIPLADPVATLRTDTGTLIVNDLFFSGHTAILFLLFLAVESPPLKRFLLAGMIFTATGVLLQHAHYSGDVFSAPFFALGSWRMILPIHKKCNFWNTDNGSVGLYDSNA
ncbi:MAG TPA: phosphatase PAP2-related protein [Candidatus Hydrogenedentes bacterium]|nr:phosphatase PAP2-related protein [Candidatus Hydrogenedentota bacterium]